MTIIEHIREMQALLIEKGEREPFRVKLSQSSFVALKSEADRQHFMELAQPDPKIFGMFIDVVPDDRCVSVRPW